MTSASAVEWRLALAREIAPHYARQPDVRAVTVEGSVARGCADRYSDIELGIYWAAPPSDDLRSQIALRVNADGLRLTTSGCGDRADEYRYRGAKIDLAHHTIGDTDTRIADVIERFHTDTSGHILASELLHAVPLSGDDLLDRWRDRLRPYPEELATAMVRDHLMLGPHSWLEMLAERNSILDLYGFIVEAEKRLLAVLLGLNRIYHPGTKWLDQLIAQLPIAPPDLRHRLEAPFRLPPTEGVAELRRLIEDVYTLVETHLPHVDTTATRTRLHQSRPICDTAPL